MFSHLPLRKIALSAGCMLVYALPVHAELSRCSDAAGNVAYLDGACPAEMYTTELDNSADAQETVAPSPPHRRSLDTMLLRESAWARAPVLVRQDKTDVATMKKAREIMQLEDTLRLSTYQKNAKGQFFN